jgi:hypothetical protein
VSRLSCNTNCCNCLCHLLTGSISNYPRHINCYLHVIRNRSLWNHFNPLSWKRSAYLWGHEREVII